MSKAPRVLLFTSSEYGQSNVVLATAYELQLLGCEIHIASYADPQGKMSARVEELNDGLYGPIGESTKATFHCISGPSIALAISKNHNYQSHFTSGTGIAETIRTQDILTEIICIWDSQEYTEGFKSCVDIIESVQPDVIVNEKLCAQAIDACSILGHNYIILSPNTFKETIAFLQPNLGILWKIPADTSGFPFPVPWYLVPANVFLQLRLVSCGLKSKHIKAMKAVREGLGLKTKFPLLSPWKEEHHYLIPATPECDFPFEKVPSNITACGPIMLESPPLSVADPELELWMQRAPTVLINLGTHFKYDDTVKREMSTAIQALLAHNTSVQVLWKLKSAKSDAGSDANVIENILSGAINTGRVRITSWLKAEPGKLVSSGSIICSVHHGGANSYFEAVAAGVPQIILPFWFDTFDFAQRVEILGIGQYGSRNSVPGVTAGELGDALLKIAGGKSEEGRLMKEKARALGEVMRGYGGRKTAAAKIVELAETRKFKILWEEQMSKSVLEGEDASD